jgi:hypothetical protein
MQYYIMEKLDQTLKSINRFYYPIGSRISEVFETNKMEIHNQGHYLSACPPQVIAQTMMLIHSTGTFLYESEAFFPREVL